MDTRMKNNYFSFMNHLFIRMKSFSFPIVGPLSAVVPTLTYCEGKEEPNPNKKVVLKITQIFGLIAQLI